MSKHEDDDGLLFSRGLMNATAISMVLWLVIYAVIAFFVGHDKPPQE